jgi:leucyl-tRNA synthetase
MKYNPNEFEKKWQDQWYNSDIYTAKDLDEREKYYVLVEFPYPSGSGLHIGHSRNYSMLDSVARLRRMMGYNVLYPMGWDAFGLPAENFAIKNKINPADAVKENSENFKKQIKSLGLSIDWSREINTTDPKFYKWTQWMFLKFLEKGLAEKKEMPINWCPSCKVGCANEEVIDGKHERCGTDVERRMKSQWVIKITEYADRLADDLDDVDYPSSIVASQRSWIGRKEWIDITYPVEGTKEEIIVSTTRPDTNFGATFIVVAPEHPMINRLLDSMPEENRKKVEVYVEEALRKTERERLEGGKEKTGIDTGLVAVNSINDSRMPIYITDFVLMSVGTGAVVGVPGHDKRDFEFAKAMGLPIKRVVKGPKGEMDEITSIEQVQEDEGEMINSEFLDGLHPHEAIPKMMEYLEKNGMGKRTTRYHLRDWIFSRQRYWGEPIPVVHCEKCGTVPLPEDQLPLVLPEVENYEPTDSGESPLAAIEDWVNTTCPNCDGSAKRETDTMPNWAGSSWYYLRYIDPNNDEEFADKKKLEYWMPVDIYDGGSEHVTLHLLYSRFWHKFLFDLGYVPNSEPYNKRRGHGVVLGEDGVRMSKSRGNVINPDDLISKYGADTTRAYLMFMGPYDADNSWNSSAMNGVSRFLRRYFEMLTGNIDKYAKEPTKEVSIAISKLAKRVNEDIIDLKFNTAVAAMMEFINEYEKSSFTKGQLEDLAKIIAPVAPHLAEEVWLMMENEGSIHSQMWPKVDEEAITESSIHLAVQINGKVRGTLEVSIEASEEEVRKMVLSDEKLSEFVEERAIKKLVYVPGRIISVVV